MARRYVGLARKIGTRHRLRLTREQKGSFCKKCNVPSIPGKTFTTSLDSRSRSVKVKCKECGYSYRKAYSRKK